MSSSSKAALRRMWTMTKADTAVGAAAAGGIDGGSRPSTLLEELDLALVLLRRFARGEGAEVATLAGLRIDLARIDAVLARLELADHRRAPLNLLPPFFAKRTGEGWGGVLLAW